MPSSLSGARAIVTGGGRGIGLAIAKLFASEGASISLVGRDQPRLRAARETLESLPNQSGTSHRTHAFDVGALEGWEAMLADLKADNIDVLVNAAGIAQNSLLSRTRAQDVQDIVNTNLMGTIWGCQTVGRRMTRQRHGCIVNVSSLLATHAGRGASVYSASKAGIVGLTRSLAAELGRSGVRINALLPGYIQTDMTASMDGNSELSARIPLGRLGLAEEVADAAAFLVKNPYAHNTVLNLDGGLSAT